MTTDWKTFKGTPSPKFIPDESWLDYKHSFQKIVLGQKTIYNEGNVITESGNSVWTPSDGAPPITPIHEPCGYWYNKERKLPRNIFYPSTGIDASLIAWMPIEGLPYGRYVVASWINPKVFASDDGGVTWYSIISPVTGSIYVLQTIYFNDGTVMMIGKSGLTILRSFNGVDWELCNSLPPTRNPDSFSHHPPTDSIVCASTGGNNICISYDKGMSWLLGGYIYPYSGYKANVYYKGCTYIISYNYTQIYRASYPTLDPWQSLTGPLSPWDYVHFQRFEAATNDEVITYSNCYFDGLKWTYHGIPISMVDYNKQLNLFAASIEPYSDPICVSIDGISWLPIHTRYPISDVAVGNDRIVGVGYNYHTTTIITY